MVTKRDAFTPGQTIRYENNVHEAEPSMSVRKLQSYFTSTSGLAALAEHVSRLSELQRLWEKIAPPPLAQMCKVSGLQDRTLVLYANNGAIAAKVRQLAPTVLEKFQKKGLEVTSILVRVQASYRPPQERPPKTLRLGSAGAARLRQLAGQLDESPLKRALESMLERHAVEDGSPHEDQGGKN
ncbi:MAG: DciA family protein [Sulfurimicrobium sp.]|nr:DciA family protein [Sulfurimicrobium sp.]